SKVNETLFNYDTAKQTLMNHFEVKSLAGFGCDSMIEGVQAAGAVLSHLEMLKKDFPNNISSLRVIDNRNHLILDSSTQRNLEILTNAFDGRVEGSLLSIFTDINTSMGARLIRRWLLQPLRDIKLIENRLETVEILQKDLMVLEKISDLLSRTADFQRLITKIKYKSANARDLIALRDSLKTCFELNVLLKKNNLNCYICQKIVGFDKSDLIRIIDIIEQAIQESPPVSIREGGIINPDYNQELSELYGLKNNQDNILEEIKNREQQRTKFHIKVGYNSVHGYYIEVTKAQLRDAGEESIPQEYIRRQTLVNAERFITPELKEIEEKILNADERICELEYQLFSEIREQISPKVPFIREFSELIAELDVLVCFAFTALKKNYCKPQISNESVIEILEGRHPVVEQLQKSTGFIPNNVILESNELHIITGPNMSGKCVTPDTVIFSNQGVLPIEDFKPGEILDETFKDLEIDLLSRWGRTKTSHFYYDGIRPTIRIETKRGYIIEGTYNHPILVRNKNGKEIWKKLSDIKTEDYIIINRKNGLWGNKTQIEYSPPNYHFRTNIFPLPSELNEDLAYLLGLLVGDGTLTYKKAYSFSSGDDFLISEFERLNKDLFSYKVSVKNDGKDYFVSSLFLRDFFRHLGLDYSKSHEKEIPKCILKSPKMIFKKFLQGLFDTDGTADNGYGNVTLSTTSKRLATQVHTSLLNWGIISSLGVKKTTRKPRYEVRLTGNEAIIFHKEIGFRLPRKSKRKRLSSSKRMTNVDSIPYLFERLISLKERYLEKSPSISPKNKLKYNRKISGIFESYIAQKRNISFHKLKELIEYCVKHNIECGELEEINENHFYYDKIKKMDKSVSEVYDFSVPNGHSFIGNGIINHNSTYIRQVALIILMAQTGSWVPASRCKFGIIDKIFTRIGAFDRLAFGQSTFMLEMLETAHILHNASSNSLIILDEVGRGTSTFDGLSLAWAIAEHIVKEIKSKTLFATHYHQLSELENQFSEIKNYHLTAKERNGKLVLLYKVKPGSTDHSFGISVAKMAGVPKNVILEAQKKLLELESISNSNFLPRSKIKEKQQPRQLSLVEALSKNIGQQKLEKELNDLKYETIAFLKN
ncbi:MAG: LAGLIDADG family homing endonuclease, partial [Candidatus Hodarchaeota archaeon]